MELQIIEPRDALRNALQGDQLFRYVHSSVYCSDLNGLAWPLCPTCNIHEWQSTKARPAGKPIEDRKDSRTRDAVVNLASLGAQSKSAVLQFVDPDDIGALGAEKRRPKALRSFAGWVGMLHSVEVDNVDQREWYFIWTDAASDVSTSLRHLTTSFPRG